MNTQDENQDTVQTSAYNPFPEPQTIPSGWDTSGFFLHRNLLPMNRKMILLKAECQIT